MDEGLEATLTNLMHYSELEVLNGVHTLNLFLIWLKCLMQLVMYLIILLLKEVLLLKVMMQIMHEHQRFFFVCVGSYERTYEKNWNSLSSFAGWVSRYFECLTSRLNYERVDSKPKKHWMKRISIRCGTFLC